LDHERRGAADDVARPRVLALVERGRPGQGEDVAVAGPIEAAVGALPRQEGGDRPGRLEPARARAGIERPGDGDARELTVQRLAEELDVLDRAARLTRRRLRLAEVRRRELQGAGGGARLAV